jgi:hypothetical protein
MDIKKLLGPRAIKRIALAYDDCEDQLHLIPEHKIHRFRRIVIDQFVYITKSAHPQIYFDFVDKDPYEYKLVEELMLDYQRGTLKINSSGNDSKLWGPVYNLMFRAVHDWIHCVKGYNFNYKDEVAAYKFQVEFSEAAGGNVDWELYEKVLRSEIVYQAAYKTYFDEFHVPFQKIILADL